MGWFSSAPKEDEPSAVTRSGRQACWDARDAYYACLDGARVLKPGDEGAACRAEHAGYETNCARSWIDYFNQRRVLAERQKGMLTQAANQAQDAARR